MAELRSLEHRHEVTVFGFPPMDAQHGHELWVDLNGTPHYRNRQQVRKQLEEIAVRELVEAKAAFDRRQWAQAEQHSSVSLLADEHNLEAMAIKIAIAGVENDSSARELLFELVPAHSRSAVASLARELLNPFETPVRRAPSESKMVR